MTAAGPDRFVVVTKVSPKDNEEASSKTHSTTDLQEQLFILEPLSLGILHILCGVLQILSGIFSDMENVNRNMHKFFLFYSWMPIWSGTLVIICGSLTLAVYNNPKLGLVWGGVTMNMLTSVASGVATMTYTMHVAVVKAGSPSQDFSNALFYTLLTIGIVGFCISMVIAVGSCRTFCRTAYGKVPLADDLSDNVNKASPA